MHYIKPGTLIEKKTCEQPDWAENTVRSMTLNFWRELFLSRNNFFKFFNLT